MQKRRFAEETEAKCDSPGYLSLERGVELIFPPAEVVPRVTWAD